MGGKLNTVEKVMEDSSTQVPIVYGMCDACEFIDIDHSGKKCANFFGELHLCAMHLAALSQEVFNKQIKVDEQNQTD